MELVEFAKNILFSEKLEDKIITPDELTDNNTYFDTRNIPALPARSRNIQFSNKTDRQAFPKKSSLHLDINRGKALHFFANHELLAMELMALALLKFQDVNPLFRMEIANTIKEEQNHFKLYTERAKELGIEFGQVPVNDFFWKSLSGMRSPSDYITHINLTFEQANLDYASFYQSLFNKLGDKKSSRIMAIVLADEIGHVKSGVHWSDPIGGMDLESDDSFENFQKQLISPVSPAWAKGNSFNKAARQSAGLPLNFIEQLSSYNASRGRPPRVYYINHTSDFSGFPGLSTEKLYSLGALLGKKQDEFIGNSLSIEFKKKFLKLGISINNCLPLQKSFNRGKTIFSLSELSNCGHSKFEIFDIKKTVEKREALSLTHPDLLFHIENFGEYKSIALTQHLYSNKGKLLAIDLTPDRKTSFCFFKSSDGALNSISDLKKMFYRNTANTAEVSATCVMHRNLQTKEISLSEPHSLTLSGHLSSFKTQIHSTSNCMWFYLTHLEIEKLNVYNKEILTEHILKCSDGKIKEAVFCTSDQDRDGLGYMMVSSEENINKTLKAIEACIE